VAHLDTKAQGHSMAGRLVAVWACIAVIPLFLGLCLWRLAGPLAPLTVAAGAGAALAAGVLAGRGRLRGETPGARDNGTGLVAVLELASSVQDRETGFLVTGAEEFGLVGARILARVSPELVRGTTIINFDTVDEVGPVRIVAHDLEGRKLGEQLRPVLEGTGLPVRIHRLPAGIFVDSLPLARAGARAVTIARLDWSTLRRIHTPRDTLDGLSLETPRRLATALAGFDLSPAGG
jgi:Zn-dependent M28 family amino/carboxypeptidase